MARGDEEFAEFAHACSARLLHAAYLLTGNRHTAEDAAQTALVRTYAAWSRVRRADAFAYARQVLINHVTDRWRLRLRESATGEVPERPGAVDVAEEVTLRRWPPSSSARACRAGRAGYRIRCRHLPPGIQRTGDATPRTVR